MAIIKINGRDFNEDYLKLVSEEEAVSSHPKTSKSEIIRAWKKANGKSEPKKRSNESK
jgi:hypothetical protein